MFYLDIPGIFNTLVALLAHTSAICLGQEWVMCCNVEFRVSQSQQLKSCVWQVNTLSLLYSALLTLANRDRKVEQRTCANFHRLICPVVSGVCVYWDRQTSGPLSHKRDNAALLQMDLVREIFISLKKNLDAKSFVDVTLFSYFCLWRHSSGHRQSLVKVWDHACYCGAIGQSVPAWCHSPAGLDLLVIFRAQMIGSKIYIYIYIYIDR